MSEPLVQAKGVEETIRRLEKVPDSAGPRRYFRATMPGWVGVIKQNFASGGRPEKWPPKYDGSPSYLGGAAAFNIYGVMEDDCIKIRTGAGDKHPDVHQFGSQPKGGTYPIFPRNAKALHFLPRNIRFQALSMGGKMGKVLRTWDYKGQNVSKYAKVMKMPKEIGGRRTEIAGVTVKAVQHPYSKIPARRFMVIPPDEKERMLNLCRMAIKGQLKQDTGFEVR